MDHGCLVSSQRQNDLRSRSAHCGSVATGVVYTAATYTDGADGGVLEEADALLQDEQQQLAEGQQLDDE